MAQIFMLCQTGSVNDPTRVVQYEPSLVYNVVSPRDSKVRTTTDIICPMYATVRILYYSMKKNKRIMQKMEKRLDQ